MRKWFVEWSWIGWVALLLIGLYFLLFARVPSFVDAHRARLRWMVDNATWTVTSHLPNMTMLSDVHAHPARANIPLELVRMRKEHGLAEQ